MGKLLRNAVPCKLRLKCESNKQILQNYKTGKLKLIDIPLFATELHNPEITVPAGAGNVPQTNYQYLAALAVLRGEIEQDDISNFVQERGLPGFAPSQGHIASAIPALPHALQKFKNNELKRAFFLAKGSLFLGRMTQLSDGISFLLTQD